MVDPKGGEKWCQDNVNPLAQKGGATAKNERKAREGKKIVARRMKKENNQRGQQDR